jgi:predicted metal-binding protein
MSATRIGILTCANTKNDACCPSVGCLDAINKLEGTFAQYRGNGGAELVGLATCAGCPTLVAPEKVLRQVRSLVASGVEAIHLSSCMTLICPFRRKYIKAIQAAFPTVEIVEATHTADEPTEQMFKAAMKGMLCQPLQSMANLIEAQAEQHQQPAPASETHVQPRTGDRPAAA